AITGRGGSTLGTHERVLVRGPQTPLDADEVATVEAGGGLVLLGAGPWDPGVLARLAAAGVTVVPRAEARHVLHGDPDAVAGTRQDVLARVVDPEGTVGAHLQLTDGATTWPALRDRLGGVVAAVADGPGGRLAVVAADLTEGPSADARRHNLTTGVAPPLTEPRHALARDLPPAWGRLKAAVAELQPLQGQDDAVVRRVKRTAVPVPGTADHDPARALVAEVADAVAEPAPESPHDAAYLDAVVTDLRRWADDGLGVPDYLDSLVAFQPQLQRRD